MKHPREWCYSGLKPTNPSHTLTLGMNTFGRKSTGRTVCCSCQEKNQWMQACQGYEAWQWKRIIHLTYVTCAFRWYECFYFFPSDPSSEVFKVWQDPAKTPWEKNKAYEWKVSHRPSLGIMRVCIYENKK